METYGACSEKNFQKTLEVYRAIVRLFEEELKRREEEAKKLTPEEQHAATIIANILIESLGPYTTHSWPGHQSIAEYIVRALRKGG
jgi:hypothetical protein